MNTHVAEGWYVTNVTQPIKCDHDHCKIPPIRTIIWHAGGMMGATTYLMIFPEPNLVVSVLSNIGDADGLDLLAVRIARNFML
jgi:hypothetical protein